MLKIDPTYPDMAIVEASVKKELAMLWAAQKRHGLTGYMALYTNSNQDPWRTKDEGVLIWFNEQETDQATAAFLEHYNSAKLPNSPLFLNPVVHDKTAEGGYTPIGSGVVWATGLVLGIADFTPDQKERVEGLGGMCDYFQRSDNDESGLKIVGFSDELLKPNPDGRTVEGCREIYEISNIDSDAYAPFYLLSAVSYLCTHGIFCQAGLDLLIPEDERELPVEELISKHTIKRQELQDANQCWNAYDRKHILYDKFGSDTTNIEANNKFYDLCARDLHLFDRTGPMREGADEAFEFVVPGYIPRGAITLLAAPGGTGKSSVAHHLCVLASMDLKEGDEDPKWLGQNINRDYCKDGICVYFSGEDGPGIVNARSKMFDPEGRSRRLQFHRSEFMDQDISFAEYLTRLQKMPNVPIVVIDPARKYLTGDEDNAEVVSEFFEAIEEFAIRKKAAVIVVHHLQKGADPKSAKDVLDQLRGSQVFIDRPRVVIGMYREGPYTCIGLAKNNIPPNLGMVTDERVFARNAENLQLMWLPGEAGVKRDGLTELELDQLKEQAELDELVAKQEAESK